MKNEHPALQFALAEPSDPADVHRSPGDSGTTSLSLARALAVGCLSGLDPNLTSGSIWDPAVGVGFAGHLLAQALQSAGVTVQFRGQDIDEGALRASRTQLSRISDTEIAHGNTLEHDAFSGFEADLVIVDAPLAMGWKDSEGAVNTRRGAGEFRYGLPQHSDSTWLWVSLALEKLRTDSAGGGRVAALVNPSVLSSGGKTDAVRRRIVDAGLLESVTRLPAGLAIGSDIVLYLLTFTNRSTPRREGTAMVADLQGQFVTERHRRRLPVAALRELESGLRTWRPGRRNRPISTTRFIRREAQLSRPTSSGELLTWNVTTYQNTLIDDRLLEARYGPNAGVLLNTEPHEMLDLDPGHIFDDDSSDHLKSMQDQGWPARRLSGLLQRAPQAVKDRAVAEGQQLFVPTTQAGRVSGKPSDTGSSGRVLGVELDEHLVQPGFLAAWLNSDQGVASRRRALARGGSGTFPRAVRSDPRSLMRWADELIVPIPDPATQNLLASADEQLGSFEAELRRQRASLWGDPGSAGEVVARLGRAFDDSLTGWLEQLPFPIASALWTAETAASPGEQQHAYFHAWEAIVTFHATVLLSASRSDPEGSRAVETDIRTTLRKQHLSIERATLGTWVVIAERTSKEFRRLLDGDDNDDIARIRRAFGDLSRTAIDRLVSKDVVSTFKEVTGKRNRWSGHGGFTPQQEREAQVASLIADLRDLRQLLGDVWAQLKLVRAGSGKRVREGFLQSAEVALGNRTPFLRSEFRVGDLMHDGELYLVQDGSETPLRLGHFVQLRAAPSTEKYTSYFYNRTDEDGVRMITYQYGSESELHDPVDSLRDEFGALAQE